MLSSPFAHGQLLILPNEKIGRYLGVSEYDYQPADPSVGLRDPYEFCLLSVLSHGKMVDVELRDVVVAEVYDV